MKKNLTLISLMLGVIVLLSVSMISAVEYNEQISFLYEDDFEGVSGDTSGWSTNDATVNLGTNTWNLDFGLVRAKIQNEAGELTHRGTRGLGVNGMENDEVDSKDGKEKIIITLDEPVYFGSVEIRSLFVPEGDRAPEEGDVKFYLDGELVHTDHFVGTPSGIVVKDYDGLVADKVVFFVKENQRYTSFSEFAVSRINFATDCILVIEEPFESILGYTEGDMAFFDSEAVPFDWYLEGYCTPIDEFDIWYEKDGDCEFDEGSWMTLESDISPGLVENPIFPDYSYTWDRPSESGLYCVKVKVSSNGARDVSGHFAVDLAPPVVSLSVGEPKMGECLDEETGDCYVNQQTEITLDCHDENPDAPWQSGVDYIEYRYQVNGGEWTKWKTYSDPFTFLEDSNHVLEYRCYDNVGKVDSESKDFIVDTVGPEFVEKTVGEPKLPCGDVVEGCDWYLTQDTDICFEYMDPQPHPVEGVEVWCQYSWQYDIPLQLELEQAFEEIEVKPKKMWSDPFQLDEFGCFEYPQDSYHELYCWAVDALGNRDDGEDQFEIDIVDTVPPETSIWFDGPQWTHPEGNGFPYWIDGVTEVVIQGEDPEPHPVNDVTTYYRYERVDDDYCWGYEQWELTSKEDPSWMEYEGRFTMEESCHIIEAWAVDALGNEGEVHGRLVFVDKTAPTLNKDVGKPSHNCNGPFSFLQNCEEGWDYIVTKETPITLSCDDEGDHPSGNEKLCYRILWDGEEIVPALECEGEVEGDYCCAYTDEVEITFGEECEHQLDFYCVDHVNKTSEIDSEIFKVEGEPFTLRLKKKWNLISVPFNLLSSNVEEVFSELDGDGELEGVWSYEDGQWKVYKPEVTSTLTDIVPGRGYWVKMTEEASLLVGGEYLNEGPILPPSIPLDEGWNLIGHYGPHPRQVYCSLFSLVDTQEGHPRWSSLFGYNSNTQNFKPMDNFDITRPGKGYWIEMDVEDNYNPATACWMPMKPMPCVGPLCVA